MKNEPIREAIEKAGSVKALAEAAGVTPQCVSQWKKIPIGRVRAIEKGTGIPRHLLRPDIFDVPVMEAV